jgi:hypothetical protein
VEAGTGDIDIINCLGEVKQRKAIEDALNKVGTKATTTSLFPEQAQRLAAE